MQQARIMDVRPYQKHEHQRRCEAKPPTQHCRYSTTLHARQNGRPITPLPAQNHAFENSPITLTSCSKSTPCCCLTAACICAISCSISAAVALPVFTIKLACFSDTCAPPMR